MSEAVVLPRAPRSKVATDVEKVNLFASVVGTLLALSLAACSKNGGDDPSSLCKKKFSLDTIPHSADSDTIKKCTDHVTEGKASHPEEFKCYAQCVNGASSWDVVKKCDNSCLFKD
jgi:hypothetical protein